MARRPSGAVASMLEKDGTKKTIFFGFFTLAPVLVVFSLEQHKYAQSAALGRQGHVMGLQKPTHLAPLQKVRIVYKRLTEF
jgi:hypothetical protein